jgi:ubiquinone biosynthesis UbiH/UbiF/VisC/COQ6 family hydroxylase
MVGISLALLLAQQQRWRVLLVESQSLEGSDGPSYSPSFDARSTALSWSSQKIFQALGLWPQLRRHASAIAQIHVSDRGHFGLTRLEAEQAGVDALGYVIENSWLGAVLMAATADTEIDLQGHTEVADIKPLAESMQLTLKDTNQQTDSPIEVNTKLLIVADGAASSCGQQLGIHRHSKSYGQSAIIANISLSSPHGGVAYERFTDQGPMALLPLSDYQNRPRSALVWTQPTESAQHLLNADKDAFLVDLQQRFGQRMGRFNDVGERVAYPLTLSTSEEQVRRRLVVIGNAAHSLHPVAGAGF